MKMVQNFVLPQARRVKRLLENTLVAVAKICAIDLRLLADRSIGIGKYENDETSGEAYLVATVIPQLISSKTPLILDVGANVGQSSTRFRSVFPNANIFAFEPNPRSYQDLQRAASTGRFEAICAAVGAEAGRLELFDYSEASGSEHASLHRGVLSSLHKSETISAVTVDVIALDSFCINQGINQIDFLKIDTEGHELAVLQGAKQLISSDRISVIQFEFNEMNVVSRSFLRDFYNALPNYLIHRLDSKKLIPLKDYDPKNENFRFQNFVAIHRSLSHIQIR